MNVLSLFDGAAIGYQALKDLGIHPNHYFSSEIDRHAMKVAEDNHPDIIQVGDVQYLFYRDGKLFQSMKPCIGDYTEYSHHKNIRRLICDRTIDLVMAGSPCQGFSASGKMGGFNDPRSLLFWHFVRLLREISPPIYLLENVKMKRSWEFIISNALHSNPIEINSRIVSAQSRVRLYWTNLNITLPDIDLGIGVNSILDTPGFIAAIRGRRIDPITGKKNDSNKAWPIIQQVEWRKDNKSNTLTTVAKDNVVVDFKSSSPIPYDRIKQYTRPLSVREAERLQTWPMGYTDAVSESQALKILGNGWTLEVIKYIFGSLLL